MTAETRGISTTPISLASARRMAHLPVGRTRTRRETTRGIGAGRPDRSGSLEAHGVHPVGEKSPAPGPPWSERRSAGPEELEREKGGRAGLLGGPAGTRRPDGTGPTE